MRAGIENFPLQLNREVRQRREKARRKVGEKRRPPSPRDFLRERERERDRERERQRERIRGNGISLTLVTDG